MIRIWQEYTVPCSQTLRKSLHAVNNTIEFILHTGSKSLFGIFRIPLFESLHELGHTVASEIRYCASREVSAREVRLHASNAEDIRVYNVH